MPGRVFPGHCFIPAWPEEEAIGAFEQTLTIDSGCASAAYQSGLPLQASGVLVIPLPVQPCAEDSSDYSGAIYHKGFALAKLGNSEDALLEFERALNENPGNAQAYHQKGQILVKIGRLDEALDAFNKSIALKPDNAQAYYDKGSALLKADRFEPAIEAFDQAIGIYPDDVNVYYSKGIALEKQGCLMRPPRI